MMLTTKPVKLYLGAAGYCTHPEFLTLRGKLPAGSFSGRLRLYSPSRTWPDTTGHGVQFTFFEETARLPNALYRHITPVVFREEDSAVHFLKQIGLVPSDIRYVILSHFHGDHIAGAKDFPEAQFIYLPRAYEAVCSLGSIAAVKAGFLAGLLPDDFIQRSLPVNDPAKRWADMSETTGKETPSGFPWEEVYDLFGDGSLLGVEVSGHAEGMMGLLLRTEQHDYFYVQMQYGRAGLSVNSADLMHWQVLLCQIGRSIDRTLTSWFTCINSSLGFASCRVIAKRR